VNDPYDEDLAIDEEQREQYWENQEEEFQPECSLFHFEEF
jgi:hypothetical protein